MKRSPKQLIAVAVLAALGMAAVAQIPSPPPYGAAAGSAPVRQERMGKFDPAKMQERIAARQERLKQKLQIVPAQEPAWRAWTATMQPPADWKRPDRAELDRLTTPERIERMRALRTERQERMDQRGDATLTFYAALSPEQKRVFDEETARRGHRGHGRHHGHHRG